MTGENHKLYIVINSTYIEKKIINLYMYVRVLNDVT